jgi:rare lipoprotein A
MYQIYKISVLCLTMICFSATPTFAQLSDLPQTGQASYISAKYAGARTSNGELYNPNDLTGSHKTLAFGTKVLVTNLSNQKSVIVRINDRPNAASPRVIDVSDAAARALDMVKTGVADVKVDAVATAPTVANAATTTATTGGVEAAPNGGTATSVGSRILNGAITLFRDRVSTAATAASTTTSGTTTTATTTTKSTTATTPATTSSSQTTGGYTLQLGFFGSKTNADATARASGTDAWVEPSQSNGTIGYKVYYGRFATRTEADNAKLRFPNSFVKAL